MAKSSQHEKYHKRRQVAFRITELAHERLTETAQLFGIKNPSQYAKAVLYRDLGLYSEQIDRRKKRT